MRNDSVHLTIFGCGRVRVRVRVNITGTKKLYYYCNSVLEVLRQS